MLFSFFKDVIPRSEAKRNDEEPAFRMRNQQSETLAGRY